MPIPSEADIERHRAEIREGLLKHDIKIPSDWILDIDVKPYLGFDIKYGFKRDTDGNPNGLWFLVYSARYPATWYRWLDSALSEIARAYIEEVRMSTDINVEVT